MAKIMIRRKSSMAGCLQSHDVYLWNTLIGELKNGGILEIPVGIGTHMLSFQSRLKNIGKNATFHVVINEPNEIVELQTKFALSGKYEVQYADNRPHIPVAANTIQEPIQNATETDSPITLAAIVKNTTGFRCPRCGTCNLLPVSEVSTEGTDFDAGNACCGYMLCGPLGLLCGATGKGKQVTSTTYWLCKDCGNKFKA